MGVRRAAVVTVGRQTDDELGIRRTLASYCDYIDDGRFAELVDLFTHDGSFVLDATPITGRAALLGFFEEGQGRAEQRGRHVTLNTVIEVTGATARARSDFVFLKEIDGRLTPVRAVRYDDELVREDGAWRLVCRRVGDPLSPGG